ncbi:MAG: hypothetical protein ACE5LG_04935, partial [Anaerolineae bacterium]
AEDTLLGDLISHLSYLPFVVLECSKADNIISDFAPFVNLTVSLTSKATNRWQRGSHIEAQVRPLIVKAL